jgi:hypothetical protein
MSITGSSFAGVIEGSAVVGCQAGGIVGYILSEIEISACYAEGHIKAEGASSNVGGIVGGAPGATIANCSAWIRASSRAPNTEHTGGIAGLIEGTIAKCYAMGELASKGQNPNAYVGGIVGGGYLGTVEISGSMALVSALDGGPSASALKYVYAISSLATFNGNYARNDMTFANRPHAADPGLNNKDGQPTPLANFTTQALYETAGWDFTAGTGAWKFVGGHDYPVLSWQTALPGAALANSGSGVVWP